MSNATSDTEVTPDEEAHMPAEQIAAEIGRTVAAPVADEVDQQSRFPAETIGALGDAGLLGALVPVELGGLGCSIDTVARTVTELARHCSSAAMVYAMHQIQVACLVRHGHNEELAAFTRAVARERLLLASATTEAGIGGNVRESSCAVERDGERFRLVKNAPVISYGRHADAVLATARRADDSPPSDQVLVLCRGEGLELEQTSGWDVLGFRGTCSLGFVLTASGAVDDVFPDPYMDISAQTMLPVSHILWASLWYGIAAAAAAKARRFVQKAARKAPFTTPPNALRLAEMTAVLQQFEDLVVASRDRYAGVVGDPERATTVGFAVAMNSLKVSASTFVVDVVQRALLICGMAGYANHGPFTLGRLLRDAYGAQLMVNNDRVNANNAQLLLVHRDG